MILDLFIYIIQFYINQNTFLPGFIIRKELENLARIYSVEEGKTITFLDLMRRGIQEKYQLKDMNDHEE